MTEQGWTNYRVHVLESLERIEEAQKVTSTKINKLEVLAARQGALWGGGISIICVLLEKFI